MVSHEVRMLDSHKLCKRTVKNKTTTSCSGNCSQPHFGDWHLNIAFSVSSKNAFCTHCILLKEYTSKIKRKKPAFDLDQGFPTCAHGCHSACSVFS